MIRFVAMAVLRCFSAIVVIAQSCSNDLDCSLNGVCTKGGTCKCDIPWTGTTCDLLDVLPTLPNSGYNGTQSGTSSWGGSIAQESDGSWHMFVSEMSDHCGLGAWTTNSQVVHATSDGPLGPYVRSEVVVPLFAHNPTVRRVNASWLMYHIGYGDGLTEPRTDCKNGFTPSSDGPSEHGNPHYTMVRSSTSLKGPWTPLGGEVKILHNASFAQPAKQWTTNPAPLFDGADVWFPYRNPASYWPQGGSSERVGMAKGSNAVGPFQDLTPGAPIFPFDIEDMYLWMDTRGNFHMLTHKKDKSVPSPERSGSVGHMYSTNGVDWHASANSPVSDTIALVDGTSVTVKKIARPQLFLVDSKPQYLSLGTAADGPGDHTTTVVLPLRGSGYIASLV